MNIFYNFIAFIILGVVLCENSSLEFYEVFVSLSILFYFILFLKKIYII
ncbi:hypothetical protein [Poseidonibacter ostreae]|nr:hypothetical protein [Poseidonibacter ostreae]